MITYNHENYIREAIEGVLQQKCKFTIELVIGEDHSTDNTASIIKDYEIQYPDLIKARFNEINLGLIPNFLKTIEECSGKYIAICEGDDYWTDPYKLQKQVAFLEDNTEYSISHTAFNYFYEESKSFEESIKETDTINKIQKYSLSEVKKNIIDHNRYRIQTNTVVFPKVLYDKLCLSDSFLYTSGYFQMCDTQLMVGLCDLGNIHFLGDITAVYRVSNGSTSRSKNVINKIKFNTSVGELRVYLSNKYRLNKYLKIKFEQEFNKNVFNHLCIIDPTFKSKVNFKYSSIKNLIIGKLIMYSTTRKILKSIISVKVKLIMLSKKVMEYFSIIRKSI
jgi:glycosyltransferase involved in cell wall biosynthesis